MSKHELLVDASQFPAEPVTFDNTDTGWHRISVGLRDEMPFDTAWAAEQLAANDPTEQISLDEILEELSKPYGRHDRTEAGAEPAEAETAEAQPDDYLPRHAKEARQLLVMSDVPAAQPGAGRHRKTLRISVAEKAGRFLDAADRLIRQKKRLGAVAMAAGMTATSAFGPAAAHESPVEPASAAAPAAADGAMGARPVTQPLLSALEHQASIPSSHVAALQAPRKQPVMPGRPADAAPQESAAAQPEAPVVPAAVDPETPTAPAVAAAEHAAGANTNADAPVEQKPETPPKINSWVCDPNVTFSMKYLMDNGMTAEGAAGLLGNAKVESGVIPDRIQGPGMRRGGQMQANVGYGLLQWTTESRQIGLDDFANSLPAPDNEPSSLRAQLGYTFVELRASYKALLNKLTSPGSSARSNAVAFMVDFERPRDHAPNGPNARIRGNYAEQIMADYPRC